MRQLVLAGTLIDGSGSDPMHKAAIVIEDGKVIRIDRHEQSLRGVEVIDLSEMVVLPGLVDCHDHLGLDMGNTEAQAAEPVEYGAARAGLRAREVLRAGITTLRNAGERGALGVVLKHGIEAGMIAGPRLLTAGRPIMRTGGHAWYLGKEADGADGFRRAIREEIKAGADFIKIMVTGGVASEGSVLLAAELTDAEVTAAVHEAHLRGKKVAAHGHGGEGVRAAVLAGVDSIEHGFLLTPEDVQLMAENDTFLVQTAGVFEAVLASDETPPHMKQKVSGAKEGFDRLLRETKDLKLKIALGTDTNHGKLWREMQLLSAAGYSQMDAIVAGTRSGGELVGDREAGRLASGSHADLIAIAADPLGDLSRLADIRLVMKAGVVEFSDPALYPRPRWPSI